MKLIQAMKQLKELQRKKDDLVKKIKDNCADLSIETPVYPDTKRQVSEWLQAHSDIIKEILRLRVAIQKTNLMTSVTIELDGKSVTKTIAEWVHRRRDLAKCEAVAWASLGDRGLREGQMKPTVDGGQPVDVKIRRYFDPLVRDHKINLYTGEPTIIDSNLEVVNAVTDLIE